LLVGERRVRGSEVDHPLGDLLDAAARPDGLVVELQVWMELVVVAEELRIEGERERRSGAVDEERVGPGGGPRQASRYEQSEECCASSHLLCPFQACVSKRR
jgi:hypothetical protein